MMFTVLTISYSLLLLTEAQQTNDQKAQMAELYKQCVSSSGVSAAVLKKLKSGEFPNDPKLKKFFGCIFKKVGVQTNDGKLLPEALKSKLASNVKPEEAKKIMSNCSGKKGTNADDTAYQFYKCYYENSSNPITFA